MKKYFGAVLIPLVCVAVNIFAQDHAPILESAPIPIATVIGYAGEVGPENSAARVRLAAAGWQVCDGRPVARVRFAKLFSVIGDTHGRGDAVATFNLPDYRGRFLRGVDAGSGRDPNSNDRQEANAGGLKGDRVGSVQDDQFALHTHVTVQMIGDNNVDGVDSTTIRSGDHHNETVRTGPAGGSETRPKNANVHWLIFVGKP